MSSSIVDAERIKLTEGWFKIADRDYLAALLLADGEPAFYDRACFFCQQAVEKLFKGIIVYHTGSYEKIHSLVTLLKMVKKLRIDPKDFTEEDMSDLDPHYIRPRYLPDAEPTEEVARKAINTVERVKKFVEHEAGLEGIEFDQSWWESV